MATFSRMPFAKNMSFLYFMHRLLLLFCSVLCSVSVPAQTCLPQSHTSTCTMGWQQAYSIVVKVCKNKNGRCTQITNQPEHAYYLYILIVRCWWWGVKLKLAAWFNYLFIITYLSTSWRITSYIWILNRTLQRNVVILVTIPLRVCHKVCQWGIPMKECFEFWQHVR